MSREAAGEADPAEADAPARPATHATIARENTWRGAEPAALPPLTRRERLRGIVRVALFALATLLALALFLPGRYLRAGLGRFVTFHFAVARLWARTGLALAGLSRRVEGTPVHGGAIVANHCSWLDILTLRAVCLMYFVSKAEVRDWPGVGLAAAAAGTVFIERRRSQAKAQEAVLRSRIRAEQLLIFFPEGTSTDGERVLPFKSSLFSAFFDDAGRGADLLIQPVTIHYRPGAASALPPSFYAWWGDMAFWAHVFDVFARSAGGTASVVFHEALRPAEEGDRKALAQACHSRVSAAHARL
ncbi:MAG: lysophospholipid acyltransferase family protein [Paracoccaceae bacterium]